MPEQDRNINPLVELGVFNHARASDFSHEGKPSFRFVEETVIAVSPDGRTSFIKPNKDILDAYLEKISEWSANADDGDVIDRLRKERLDLAERISTEYPHLISSERLKGKELFLEADLLYLDRPDPSSADYIDFARERDAMRRALFQDKPVLTADDYKSVAERTASFIESGEFVRDQYDLLDLRREAALEHFNDPRFIIGVSKNKDLLDELLVDLNSQPAGNASGIGFHEGKVDDARTDAYADIFIERVGSLVSPRKTPAERVQEFQALREIGLNIVHEPMAIVKVGDAISINGATNEIGLSALDNVRWGEGVFDSFQELLTPEQKQFMISNPGPAAAFSVARQKFEEFVTTGDGNAALSFAVMERAASVIGSRRDQIRKLEEIGVMDDVAAFHVLGPRHREEALGKISRDVDLKVISSVQEDIPELVSRGERSGTVSTGKDGDYSFDLDESTYIRVIDGSHVSVSRSQEDFEAGKMIAMRIDGILTPPTGAMSKSGAVDAGLACKKHLEEVLARHSMDGLSLKTKVLDSGETVLAVKMSHGEDLGERMLRDGFAIPSLDKSAVMKRAEQVLESATTSGKHYFSGRNDARPRANDAEADKDVDRSVRREYLAKQAEGNGRGLWREGFPPMDQSWRSERMNPDLSWKDKRAHLVNNVTRALCVSHQQVQRNLSRSETRLFALPLETWSGSPKIDNEIAKIIKRNPSRIMDIYSNNMEILDDLRKRKDSLTQEEKYAHDQLAMGRRALGQSLVDAGILDERKFRKDTHPFMSQSGIQVSLKGVRKVIDATAEVADTVGQMAKPLAKQGARGMMSMLNEAMS